MSNTIEERVVKIVSEKLSDQSKKITSDASFIAVSYTHLTLPTTPYV